MVSGRGIARREFLGSFGLAVVAVPMLAACGGGGGGASAPAATAAAAAAAAQLAAKASATQVAGAPAAAPTGAASATQVTTGVPTAQPAPATGAKAAVSIATYAGPANDWQRYWAKQWATQHSDVTLAITEVPYPDAPKKQLAELATGTMQDVAFSGIKWFPYSVFKGVFRPIDSYIKQTDPGLDDFFSAALAGAAFEGKQYGLPYLMHPGNAALVVYNLDILTKKGVKEPTDDWNVQDYLALMQATAEPKVPGTTYFPNTYYDFCSLARTWGGDDLSQDGKKFTFATDPKSVEAARWATDLRTKYKVAPTRTDAQAIQFAAGQAATTTTGTYAVLGLGKTIANKFQYGSVLFPKGPTGIRGYQGFVENFAIYSKSKQPELAYSLIMAETSKEAGIWSVINNAYQPSGRKSVWAAPEIDKISSIFKRALDWMGSVNGPFPLPSNLRFQELEDKWENVSQPLFYGEVAFDQGLAKVQDECQAIMDLPRS